VLDVFFSVDGPFYSLPQFKCDVVILGIDLGVAHCADLPGDLLWADHHALWAQVISNCAFGKKKWLLEFCMQREEIKNFPWFILFVPCATVGCQLLPVSCTIHFVCWLPVRKWFLLLLKVQFNEWSWNCKILLVSAPGKWITKAYNVHVHFLRICNSFFSWFCLYTRLEY